MAFDVNSFKQNISKYGILQTNRFEVSIPLNTNLASVTKMGLSDMSRLLTFRADKAILPPAALVTIDNPIFGIGPVQKMPSNIVFEDVEISFLADSDGEIYNFLYGWLNYIYDFSGINNSTPTYSLNYKDNYVTDVSIITFDNQGNAITTHTLHRAYPTAIGAIPLDWGNNNTLMKVSILLTYFTCSLTKNIISN
jgi:hypothetical protein